MNKIYPFLLAASLVATLNADQASEWQQFQSQQAMQGLDAEFEDEKPAPVVKTVVKEKVVYKDRPVEVEKVVYKDRVVEKVVYRDRPAAEVAPKTQETTIPGRKYNQLFLNVSVPNDANFVNDYVKVSNRTGSFDWSKLKEAMHSAPGGYSNGTIVVSGMIEIPASINAQDIIIKPIGYRTGNIKIAGLTWNSTELNLPNAYIQSRSIPFSYKYSGRTTGIAAVVNQQLSSINFVISNKPTQRGEKKNFVATKIFIQE